MKHFKGSVEKLCSVEQVGRGRTVEMGDLGEGQGLWGGGGALERGGTWVSGGALERGGTWRGKGVLEIFDNFLVFFLLGQFRA